MTALLLQEVYRGNETCYTVNGLQFNTSYTGRVKAFNEAGHGPYSQPLCLRIDASMTPIRNYRHIEGHVTLHINVGTRSLICCQDSTKRLANNVRRL